MPSFRLLRGVHQQRGMSGPGLNESTGRTMADIVDPATYVAGDVFWHVTDLAAKLGSDRFELVTPSTYQYQVDDNGLSLMEWPLLYNLAVDVGVDVTGYPTVEPNPDKVLNKHTLCDAIAAAVDA